ncbi:hypothetical protein D3C80_520130 [compost metagenome]
MQPGQALVDHALALLHGVPGVAAGVGGQAGVAGHLLDGRFQFAQGVADLGGAAGLVLGPGMQAVVQLGQGAAAAGHLFGVLANGAHQFAQVVPQAVEGFLDPAQVTGAGAQRHGPAEIAGGPGAQCVDQPAEDQGQAALDAVDGQGDQQDQADHQALDQPYLALDAAVLGTHLGLQGRQRRLQGFHPLGGGGGQFGAALDQFAGAGQFARVALEQAGQLTLEGDATVLGLAGFSAAFQAHHGGEVVGCRAAAVGHAEQGQLLQPGAVVAQCFQFAQCIGGQFVAAAGHQLGAGLAEAVEVLGGGEQRCTVVGGGRSAGRAGVLGQLVEGAGDLPFGLDQQPLRVARQLAGGEQVATGEFAQLIEARQQLVGELGG